MATVSTEYKRLFLRDLQWSAEDQNISLADALKAAARGRLSETKTGRVIISTAGNGKSVSFNTPSSASFSPQVAAELCSELLDRYDAAVAYLGGTPTDADILAEMLAMLQVVAEASTDFSDLRTYA